MAGQVKVLKAAKLDAIIMVGAYTQCAAFVRDVRAAGYEGWLANLSFVGPDALLRQLKKEGGALTDRLVNSQVVPNWADSSIPLVAEYGAAMDKFKPHLPAGLADPGYEEQKRSFMSFEGYINARYFARPMS
jgi:ABC-type branched-subunit amino acid transport system substrate-binding protein